MLSEETRRKLREMNFGELVEALDLQEKQPEYMALSFDDRIPKDDKATLAKIKKAIEAAKEAAKEKKWNGKIPANLKLPMHDGDIDRPDDENYAGHFFFNATSKDAPQIVDRHVQPILDPMECGSGDYCNVSVNFYGFAASGNKGIAAGLQNIQLVRHGERLAGRPTAASDFVEVEGEDDGFDGDDDMGFLS